MAKPRGRNMPQPLSTNNQPTLEDQFDGPKRRAYDEDCGFVIEENFQRFNACNDVFSRVQWDEGVRSEKGINWFKSMFTHGLGVRNTEGYRAKDFALRNAAWVGSNLLIERNLANGRHDGFLDDLTGYAPPAPVKIEIEDPAEMAAELKQVARIFGADLIGITSTDLRWHYNRRFSAKSRSEKENADCSELPNCIVIGTEMPGKVIQTFPSALAGTAAGFGYSKDGLALMSIAQFIRNMGYRAIASLNDTAQCIPYAIQAGLGEYGRHGLVITKQYGPRLRFGKIFTDMPLAHDQPVKFGVKEFCDICRRCADACPPKAIPHGEPDGALHNQSNFVGIKKWNVDGEKCFKFWANQGTECGICIRVCPYNKLPETKLGKMYFRNWKWLAGTRLRRLALWLDIKLRFGERFKPDWWWKNRPGW
ncbi:MAG: reductive dehalogenase [Alphaproteobacteria bacterium]|nr:reductive dehalogenase [Alphaproteobacteria bacterium]